MVTFVKKKKRKYHRPDAPAGDREDNGGVRVHVREVARAAGPRGERQHAG